VVDPASPPELIEYVLHLCDIILVMTVNPALAGSPSCLRCCQDRRIRAMCAQRGLDPVIEVDGARTRRRQGRQLRQAPPRSWPARRSSVRRITRLPLRRSAQAPPRGLPSHERSAFPANADRDALKRAAAEAAVELVEMAWLSGSVPARRRLRVEALARRCRQGLRFVGISTSSEPAVQARAAGIPLSSFAEHRQIDLTIDGADEVERAL